MGVKIAIGGKGGVGKTTVCAVWAQLFAGDGLDVLAIDADPNTNLGLAFGIAPEKNPEPLIAMKELIGQRTGAGRDTVGSYFRLNPEVSDLPERYWVTVGNTREGKGVKLLVLGGITQAGSGCACPEGDFLKAMLMHTILQRDEMVLVDLAAGVEFLGRASVQGIDALVVVVEPGARSIETANNIARMASRLGIRYVAAVVNKTTDESQGRQIRKRLTMPVLVDIQYSEPVQAADLAGEAVFEASEELVNQLRSAKSVLERNLSI
jgi:CO dehydrogenase maturation factor